MSKRYSSYKSQPKVFKLFLNFLPKGPHKTMFGIFEILKIEILTFVFVFLNMRPYGSKHFKALLLLQFLLSFDILLIEFFLYLQFCLIMVKQRVII